VNGCSSAASIQSAQMHSEPKTAIILLVEDSEDDAFFFNRTLQKSGMTFSVSHVPDGAQAIAFLQNAMSSGEENFPQTIFLDLKMPVVNGFEVLEWIRTQTFPVPVVVIVLSGSEQADDKERAAQLGAADYLVKPIRVSDLHRVFRNICPHETGAPL